MKFYKICRGVSHTPSTAAKWHVRGWWFVGCYHFVFVHLRAYAIRPYTCSIEILGLLDCVLLVFSLTSGRMRYAPTLVRLKLRLTISRQNRQMNSSDAGTGHTKPSNELILPWYGCDKTLKRFATMLTRVTQKGQTIPFTPR